MFKKKTFIIAEIGINHNGNFKLAKKLISKAKIAGADAVKFQTFIPEEVITKNCELAKYQKSNLKNNIKMIDMVRKYFLSFNQFKKLKEYSVKKNIEFISSPFDIISLNFLVNTLKIQKIKIPSGEITNTPLLEKIGKANKFTILSTGLSNIGEITNAVKILKKNGLKNKNLAILHCNTNYPAKFEELNLKAIPIMKKKFKCKIGYSDHSIGFEVPIAAVTVGAEIIEKHFTLNKKLKGPDHMASSDFNEFSLIVKSIRNIEKSLGEKKIKTKSEIQNLKIVRKSLVASKSIKIGDKFTINNITTKRPFKGICASKYNKYLGRKSKFNFKMDDFIK